MSGSYTVQTMSRADIGTAVGWAAGEGWNPGHEDANIFPATDPAGFIGGYLDQQMIASISVINYDAHFAFVGFYIVDAPYRGRGYGFRLWQDAIGHAGRRVIGLDGVIAEQDSYRRSGFELAYRNIRYGGTVSRQSVRTKLPAGISCEPVAGMDETLTAFDRALFPAPRASFLEAWISGPGHIARAAYKDGALAGYGVIRPCHTGYKVGPLFARDHDVAAALLPALISDAEGADDRLEIFLDVPEPNRQAVRLAESLRLEPVFETARMYCGPAPEIDLARIFGVTTFELG